MGNADRARDHAAAITTVAAVPLDALVERLKHLVTVGAVVGAMVGIPSAFGILATPRTPPPPQSGGSVTGHPSLELRRADDGMFYAPVRIGNRRVECLVDTGATTLTLGAKEVGALAQPGGTPGHIETAGGRRAATRTALRKVEVAGRPFADVPVVLVRGGGMPCLLGQQLLRRIGSVHLERDVLRLG